MIKLRHFYAVGSLMAFLALASCQSNEPDYLKNGNLRPYSIGIQDAQSLVRFGAGESRAVDGQFESTGLYKILPDGSIETVAITFTEDEDGNKLTNEVKLSPYPNYIVNMNDFIYLGLCAYFDPDGDSFIMNWDSGIRVEPINRHLIIDKHTNKIYALDGNGRADNPFFVWESLFVQQESSKSLLIVANRNLFRVTFSDNNAVALQNG